MSSLTTRKVLTREREDLSLSSWPQSLAARRVVLNKDPRTRRCIRDPTWNSQAHLVHGGRQAAGLMSDGEACEIM